jgi:hypothetical protein
MGVRSTGMVRNSIFKTKSEVSLTSSITLTILINQDLSQMNQQGNRKYSNYFRGLTNLNKYMMILNMNSKYKPLILKRIT